MIAGKGLREGVLEGEVDWPLPKRAEIMMKYSRNVREVPKGIKRHVNGCLPF